jgi:hypothetical protein
MKKLIMPMIVMLALGTAGSALAVIDWAGAVYPNNGATVVPTGPIDVYAQVFKGGVTDAPGQGADISAVLIYTTDIAAPVTAPMVFLGDNGPSNDEYTVQVPQAVLLGAAWVDVTIVFTDATDGSELEVLADQAGNAPPFRYIVTNVLPNDVTVHFTLCMSGTATAGDPCVIGSAPEIGVWGTGVNMTNVGGELYEVAVTFLAGGNPSFEYKFKKDGCADWEGVPNRLVTLPTDGTTDVVLAPDSWNNTPIGCDLGTSLTEDKVICFQACLSGVDNIGGVCVTGSLPELTLWGDGAPMTEIATDLYQTCLIIPAGTLIPLNIEYKFKKDDCQTWEGFGNKLFTVDNSSAAETTLTNTWEDGTGVCDPVGVERTTWGGAKSLFR